MTISSMTGFAQVQCTIDETPLLIEARSVNSKSTDFRFRLPHGFDMLEQKLRAIAANKLSRGSVQFSFTFHPVKAQKKMKIDEQFLQEVAKIAKEVEEKYALSPARVDGLLSLDGVILAEHGDETSLDNSAQETILQAFSALVDDLCEMREKEGEALKNILLQHIDEIERLTNVARDDKTRTPEMIQQRLHQSIKALFDEPLNLNPDKIYAEAVLLAMKADIQEELDRLDAHINATRELLNNGGVIGRKLDFLAQEFNRETNTLCSKANSVSLSQTGLALKNTVDQLREQIQNIA